MAEAVEDLMFGDLRNDIVVSQERRKSVPHDVAIEERFLKCFFDLIDGHWTSHLSSRDESWIRSCAIMHPNSVIVSEGSGR